jgi:hypothetical protein
MDKYGEIPIPHISADAQKNACLTVVEIGAKTGASAEETRTVLQALGLM